MVHRAQELMCFDVPSRSNEYGLSWYICIAAANTPTHIGKYAAHIYPSQLVCLISVLPRVGINIIKFSNKLP